MDGGDLSECARQQAETLPGSELTHPFGPDWDVYKVRGKVFMLATELSDEPLVTLKAHPEDAAAMCQAHASIAPGYHMNKRHWVTLRPGDDLDPGLVEELVTDSYLLVVAGLPRRARPVDPAAFGRGAPDDPRAPR